ncbi:MAG: iron-containing alcohol dehydrogenase [Alphaproteobacteria bacterium]|nr:iron-containing alcohol dehydrogenase [Alphaproteobacteria bacterium]
MQSGSIVFTKLDRVIFGQPAAQAVTAEADRLSARRVFLLTGRSLNRETSVVGDIVKLLGPRCVGLHDDMPPHSPREAVVACANKAREAGADLLVTVGGGSVTDGGKAVTICLKHGIREVDGLEPFRTTLDDKGKRQIPAFAAPDVRQVAVPTTLSGGEFNARAGITDARKKLKQSYMNPGIIPVSVILDPAITVHTPQWLWLSTGIRAVDHAVETYCSLDANPYTDGAALHALRVLGMALPRVKNDPADLEARLACMMGAWISMTGIVTGTRLGASHAIGHILGGSANVPHGHTSCVMLPCVLDYNRAVNAERQAEIAAALGQPGEPAGAVLDRFIAGLGMPRTLRQVGIAREQLPTLAQNCMLDDWTFSNPRAIRTPEAVMSILEAAF